MVFVVGYLSVTGTVFSPQVLFIDFLMTVPFSFEEDLLKVILSTVPAFSKSAIMHNETGHTKALGHKGTLSR